MDSVTSRASSALRCPSSVVGCTAPHRESVHLRLGFPCAELNLEPVQLVLKTSFVEDYQPVARGL